MENTAETLRFQKTYVVINTSLDKRMALCCLWGCVGPNISPPSHAGVGEMDRAPVITIYFVAGWLHGLL